MLYDQLIAIIDSHKHHIARSLLQHADKQPSQKIKNHNTSMELRIRGIISWLDSMIIYIRESDSELWRTEITQQIERSVRVSKYSIDELLKVSEATYHAIDKLIDQEIPDEKLRERFHRRIQGLSTSTSTVTRVVAMRINNEHPK